MTNKEIHKIMEFIIQRQESFAEGMDRLEASQAKSEGRISRLEGAFVTLYNTVSKLSDTVAEEAKSNSESIKALRETQTETDERLNSLINVLERLISDRRNGGSST
jgi:predicted  nucleic acid-binding Zn-ribbon protein